jgi:cytoskeletal protein CcmA (bactofilin family)
MVENLICLQIGWGIRGGKMRKAHDEGWSLLSVLMIVVIVSVAVITIVSVSRENQFTSESVFGGAQAESESLSILSLLENKIQTEISEPAQLLTLGEDPIQSLTQWLTGPSSLPNSLQSQMNPVIQTLTEGLNDAKNMTYSYAINTVSGSNTVTQTDGQTKETQKYSITVVTSDKVSGVSRSVSKVLTMTAVTGDSYQVKKGGWSIAGNDAYANSYLVEGSFNISGNPTIAAPQYVVGSFNCSGNAHIESSISVDGDASISGNPNFEQPVYIHGDLNISGSPEINSTIYVAGNVTISGNPAGSGKICVTDAAKIDEKHHKFTIDVCPFPVMSPPDGDAQLSGSFSNFAMS